MKVNERLIAIVRTLSKCKGIFDKYKDTLPIGLYQKTLKF